MAGAISDYPMPPMLRRSFLDLVRSIGSAGHRFKCHRVVFPDAHGQDASLPDNFSKASKPLGWSIVSDMLVFSQRDLALFVLLSAITGVGFAFLVCSRAQIFLLIFLNLLRVKCLFKVHEYC